jgi:hypothetical protein
VGERRGEGERGVIARERNFEERKGEPMEMGGWMRWEGCGRGRRKVREVRG